MENFKLTRWKVLFHPEFQREFDKLEVDVQDRIVAQAGLLELEGPRLSRPYVDSLNSSRHPNMKELRFRGQSGVWRIAFAFDPERQAVLLVAGNKEGQHEPRFYKTLIARADDRFNDWLTILERPGK